MTSATATAADARAVFQLYNIALLTSQTRLAGFGSAIMGMVNGAILQGLLMVLLTPFAAAIYLVDPAEINFDLRGSLTGQQPAFMPSNEAQQKLAKDRGLRPLLNYIADAINEMIIARIDPRYELAFVGLDAKTEEAAKPAGTAGEVITH